MDTRKDKYIFSIFVLLPSFLIQAYINYLRNINGVILSFILIYYFMILTMIYTLKMLNVINKSELIKYVIVFSILNLIGLLIFL